MPVFTLRPALLARPAFGRIGADHDEVRVELLAAAQAHALHAAVAEDLLGVRVEADADAHAAHRAPEHRARGAVELLVHEVAGAVYDGDVRVAVHEAVGRLEAEEAAAYDHGSLRLRLQHLLGVAHGSEDEDAVFLAPDHRGYPRRRARRQHQLVVGDPIPVVPPDLFGGGVDLLDPHAEPDVDAALGVPVLGPHPELFEADGAGHVLGEAHPVVGPDVLVPVEGHGEAVRRLLHEAIHERRPRNTVSYNYDLCLAHINSRSTRRWTPR